MRVDDMLIQSSPPECPLGEGRAHSLFTTVFPGPRRELHIQQVLDKSLLKKTSEQEARASRNNYNNRGYHLLSTYCVPDSRVHEGKGCICFACSGYFATS